MSTLIAEDAKRALLKMIRATGEVDGGFYDDLLRFRREGLVENVDKITEVHSNVDVIIKGTAEITPKGDAWLKEHAG